MSVFFLFGSLRLDQYVEQLTMSLISFFVIVNTLRAGLRDIRTWISA